jgi:hypothetical protein
MIDVAIFLTKDEILRGVHPEPSLEILRCAQNDRGEGLRMTILKDFIHINCSI